MAHQMSSVVLQDVLTAVCTHPDNFGIIWFYMPIKHKPIHESIQWLCSHQCTVHILTNPIKKSIKIYTSWLHTFPQCVILHALYNIVLWMRQNCTHLTPMTLSSRLRATSSKDHALSGWHPYLFPSSHWTLKLEGGRIRRTSLMGTKRKVLIEIRF